MKLSDAEWQVMKALWRCQPATVREVRDPLSPAVEWADTTGQTMLTRLEAKGAGSERKEGNVSVYEALLSQESARGNALSTLLNQVFDGAVEPVLQLLVTERKLTPRQRRELARLLEEEDRKE